MISGRRSTALAFSLGILGASPAAAQSPPAPGETTLFESTPEAAPPPPPSTAPPVVPPAPEAPRGGPTWQLDGSLAGALYSIRDAGTAGPSAPTISGKRASGGLEAIHFFQPVVDDGTPRSIQPFLQRASTLSVRLGGGGFVTSNPFGGVDRTYANLSAGAGLDVYLTRHFALTAGLGYGYDVLHDVGVSQKAHTFSGSLGVGVRIGDGRLDASYTFSASDVDGHFPPPRWGTAKLSAFIVIEQCFTLSPWGLLLQGGGEGGLDLGFYVTPNLGFFLSGFGGRGELYSNDGVVNRYGGRAGLSYWIGPLVRMAAYYAPTFDDVPTQVSGGYHEVEHALTLEAAVRLP